MECLMPYVKSKSCKFCDLSFVDLNTSERANHTRWCNNNPKRNEYNKNLEYARSCQTDESREKTRQGVIQAHKNGKYDHVDFGASFRGKKHTKESRERMSIGARKSKHRRLRRGMVEYNGIMLDSKWELALAIRLDEINVTWIRPEEPLPYIDNEGKQRNYFPDFYLPDYDIYLDPKNPHAIQVQKPKLDIILETYSNIIIIDNLNECETWGLAQLVE